MQRKSYWFIVILLALSLVVVAKGCRQDRNPTAPKNTRQQGMKLVFPGDADLRTKAIGLTVQTQGLDEQGAPTTDVVERSVTNLSFPLDVNLTLYDPPCRWRITVTLSLVRDPPRTASTEINVCQTNYAELVFDAFEPLLIPPGVNPMSAPSSANSGEAIGVSCGPVALSAPDSDTYPPVAMLSEQGGQSLSGSIGANTGVSGSFPDPYPLTSPATQRVFTCTISDGRSPTQTFTVVITRIALTPTPTPTITPTGTPINTPTPTATPTIMPTPDPSVPTPTPTTTPIPCQVANENDSGSGSLRQVLANAVSNGCTTITFAPGVSTITLTSGRLNIPAMTLTIDGGSGVTISGNDTYRVFYVVSGANVTFDNLLITHGYIAPSNGGAGIWNGGTVTIGSGTTVSYNTGYTGVGIFNQSGATLTVNAHSQRHSQLQYGDHWLWRDSKCQWCNPYCEWHSQ